MKNTLLAVIITAAAMSGCTKDIGSTPSDPSFAVSALYGAGANGRVYVAWSITDGYVSGVDLYRSTEEVFSASNATLLASRLPVTAASFTDSAVTNGTTYYYTAVPYHAFADGSVDVSSNRRTVALTPRDWTQIGAGDIIYSKHIQTLFTSGCAVHGCHASTDAGVHRLPKGMHGGSSYDLSTWESALEGTDHVAQIVPFRASKSHLIQHLNRDTTVAPAAQPAMPPGFPFPSELRDLLIWWIDAGAKKDDGTVPFTAMPARGLAYVTNQGEDLTAVIDLDRHRIIRYVTTGRENTSSGAPFSPHNVAVDRQNQFYYVNLIGGSRLLRFRVSDNAPAGELTAGVHSPAQVALSPSGDTAYVTNFEDARTSITVVHTPTMSVIGSIGTPAMLKPHGVTMTPDGSLLLVMNSFSDNVTIIRTSDQSVLATVPVSGSVPPLPAGYLFRFEPYQAVITPDGRYAYITCRSSGEVRVLDIPSRTVIDSITVGATPLIPAISPDGSTVYVANRNSNSVSVISTATRSVTATIGNVGVEPHGVAVTKDGKYVYVSCENLGVSDPPHHPTTGGKKAGFVKVIDAASRTVTASIETGNFGSGLAVTH